MHIVSDSLLQRAGYTYRNGIGYPNDARPYIKAKHIDGPLLVYLDGQMHWLTIKERFRFWMGWETAESLEAKRRPDLCGPTTGD